MSNFAAKIGNQAADFGVNSAYGAPQDVGGVSITPVALTITGFGAGSVDAETEGGGGSGVAIPLGVYVRREEGVRFEVNPITFLAVAVPFVCVAGRALTKIIRALKK